LKKVWETLLYPVETNISSTCAWCNEMTKKLWRGKKIASMWLQIYLNVQVSPKLSSNNISLNILPCCGQQACQLMVSKYYFKHADFENPHPSNIVLWGRGDTSL
jgi:hypothetical protein